MCVVVCGKSPGMYMSLCSCAPIYPISIYAISTSVQTQLRWSTGLVSHPCKGVRVEEMKVGSHVTSKFVSLLSP